jgi:group I intron endonuclease
MIICCNLPSVIPYTSKSWAWCYVMVRVQKQGNILPCMKRTSLCFNQISELHSSAIFLNQFEIKSTNEQKKITNEIKTTDEIRTIKINNTSFVIVIVYLNTETEKKQILSENKGKAGIYMWTHNESSKIYVGSAVNLSTRLSNYYSPSMLKKFDNYISRALLHHGYSAFTLSIVEYIDITNLSKEESRKLILSREQYYLDLIFSEDKPNTFNILKVAGSPLGNKLSEDTKAKIREALLGKNSPNYGKSFSKNTKALMSKAKSGENNPMYGKTPSAETIKKLSIAKGGGIIYVYDIHGTLVYSFSSGRKAAEFFECHNQTIMRHIKNQKIFKKQWILSISENNNTQKSD